MTANTYTYPRKVGRKKAPERLIAEQIGLEDPRQGARRINRLGGAERLIAMSPEAREFMLGLVRKKGAA